MTEHKIKTAFISLILFASIISPLFAAGFGSAASDWPSVTGEVENQWISDALAPTIDEDLSIKWSVIGTTSGMDGWEVPSTAITVGDYAYYYDKLSKKLMKVYIEDGAEAASVPLTAGGYNLPVTYGNGKLFVPMINSKVSIYDADTMEKIGTTDTRLTKWNGMQGPVAYHDGYIYLGTYGGTNAGIDFACFHEDGTLAWSKDGGGWGYVHAPQFIEVGGTTYCVVASKGYGVAGVTDGGSTVYVLDPETGYEYSKIQISDQYVQGGISHYEGRVYVAAQNEAASVTSIHSYVVGADGSLSDEKVWTSSLTGGTQSAPVIYNDRIYLGSGGATAAVNRNIEVISIGSDGSMSSVYDIPIKTKGTLTLTTAYATAENDYTVYLYCTPYNGLDNPDVYIIKDSAHQTAANYKGIELPGEGDQYSFNSVTISRQGYLLFKSDVALWCVEAVREEYTPGTEFTVSASSDAEGKLIVTYDPAALRYVSATNATNVVTAERAVTITTADANRQVDITFEVVEDPLLGPTRVTLNGADKVFKIVPTTFAPGIPTNLVATAGDGQVTLTWNAPENNGGEAIRGYIIYVNSYKLSTYTVGEYNETTTTITGLVNGRDYAIAISAFNPTGESGRSAEITATPTDVVVVPEAPGAPTNLVATAGDGQVTLTWGAPANNGGAAITNYVVYQEGTRIDGTFTGTSATITGLTNGNQYRFTVAAVNSVGESTKSNEVTTTPIAPASVYTYKISGGTVKITKYTGSGGIVEIPSTIEGLPVTAIDNNAFQNNAGLTAVTIPDTVITIGTQAFNGCSNLASVSIGENVTTLGTNAFRNTALTSVAIPDNVTTIGARAFDGCTALTSVTIGSGVTSISDSSFQGCTGLTEVNIHADNTAYKSVDGIIYSKDGTTLTLCPAGRSGSLTVPDSVTIIGASAFYGCTGLTTVTMSDNVISIGASAFYGCTGLASFVVPDSVTSMGDSVFRDCTGLTSISIGENVTGIGQNAFQDCTGLTEVTIPNNVTSIGKNAFSGCTELTSVIVGNGVTTIGEGAFSGCTKLISVTIGSGVTSIDDTAFSGCTALPGISIHGDNTAYKSVDGIIYSKDGTTLTLCPAGRSGSLTIPDSVTAIGDGAFQGCTGLTSVIMGDSVISIGEDAFTGCTGLTEINVNFDNAVYGSAGGIVYDKSMTTLILCPAGWVGPLTVPDSVTTIRSEAFLGCIALTSVTIPGSVTLIDAKAFKECTALTSVTIGNGVGTIIETQAFSYCPVLSTVTIGNGVTTINGSVFRSCPALTSIIIPDSVTSIGGRAFQDCTGLTSITIGNGVTTLQPYTFQDCTALETLIMGSGMTSIGNNAFYGCTGLSTITIPDGVTSIGNNAFYGCTGLTKVVIGSGVTTIGSSFSGCTALTTVVFTGKAPSTVSSTWVKNVPNPVVHYYLGAEGFTTPTWNNVPSYPFAIPDFEADVTSGDAPLTVQFTDRSLGAASVQWDFGDGATSTAWDPSHTYSTPGRYTVILTAFNAGGGSTTATMNVTVTAPPAELTAGTEITVSATSDADGRLSVTYDPSALRFVSATGATSISNVGGTVSIVTAGANGPVELKFVVVEDPLLGPTRVTLNGEDRVFDIVPGDSASYSSFVIVEQDAERNVAEVSLYKVPPIAGFKLVFHYTDGIPAVNDLAGLGAKGSFSTSVDEAGKTITVVWASSNNIDLKGILFSISGANGLTLAPADAEFRYISDDINVSVRVSVGVAGSYEDAVSRDPNPGTDLNGDLNGDGAVDLADLILLMQHLAGYEVSIDENNADLDDDGIVDIRDAIALQQLMTAA